MKEIEEMESRISVMLMTTNSVIVDANEKIGKLSERLGRIMIKHGKIDHTKTGLFPWLSDYWNVKDTVVQSSNELFSSYKSTLEYVFSKKVYPNQAIMAEFNSRIAQFSSLRIRIGVLDDILKGLLEDIWDEIHFEEVQKEKLEKAVKDTIEKTKELPMYA